MGWLDDLTSPDIFGGGDPEVGSSDWFTQGLSDLQPTDYTSGITGAADWLSPVGSETGNYFTDPDIFGGDWLGGGDGGDDWIGDWFSSLSDPEVGSADWVTQGLSDLDYGGSILDQDQDYYTDADIFGTSFLEDLLSGNLPEATYDPATGVGTGAAAVTNGAAGGEDPAAELTGWQKFLQGIIGSGSGPFGGSILGPQGEGDTQGVLGGILSLLGIGGGGGGFLGGGAGEAGEGLGGLFGSNPLMAFLMMKSLMKDDKSPAGMVPIGQQAYGGEGAYNMPDYRVTNLKPALMPGVGYANMPQPQQPPPQQPPPQPQQPRGYNQGGLAGLMELLVPSASAEIVTGVGDLPVEEYLDYADPMRAKPEQERRLAYLERRLKVEEDPTRRKYLQSEIEHVQKYIEKLQEMIVEELPSGYQAGGLAGLMGYQGGGRTVDPRAVGAAAMRRNAPPPVSRMVRPPQIGGMGTIPPRGWQEGGLTSLSEGPGDVTLAKLEPGEFVMTRKATQNIGAKNLYDLMKRAEGRGG